MKVREEFFVWGVPEANLPPHTLPDRTAPNKRIKVMETLVSVKITYFYEVSRRLLPISREFTGFSPCFQESFRL